MCSYLPKCYENGLLDSDCRLIFYARHCWDYHGCFYGVLNRLGVYEE